MIDQIKEFAQEYALEIKGIREYIHQNPELSFQEFETQKFVESKLKDFGISNFKRIGNTGIVGVIEGAKPGKVKALRADLDALPIFEKNNCSYKSNKNGVMHACGHDVHTACLLGALKIINQLKSELHGSVKFIFQPGEEKLPGGASMLIEEGVLKNPEVNEITGQHVFPDLEVGKVGFRPGMYMASCDEIYLTVKGNGGHGAMPHKCIDVVYIASQLVVSLQNVVSRKLDPTIPAVLSFGKIEADAATNVIPAEVKMAGTFRILNEEWRAKAHDIIESQCNAIAETYGAEIEVDIHKGYPFVDNDIELTNNSKTKAIEYLGADNVIDLPIRMTGEDFAFYSQQVPATFYRLGVRNEEKGITYGVHHPNFDVDPDCFEIGMGLMAYLVLKD